MKLLRSLALIFVSIIIYIPSNGQHSLEAVIVNEVNKEVLPGASIQLIGTSKGTSADASGSVILHDIPSGDHQFEIRFIGFDEKIVTLTFPLTEQTPVQIGLTPTEEELEEIVITTTRSSRSIEAIPTRVEFIGEEELQEKITMQPGNIRLVLSESTGIQSQQTSVASANTTIRIQGLDGRYTQLLKDGFPLFGGFSGGLSIMQIPPLDLQQVDLIKGSASTLYGGGAIAGLVNLISKQPKEERELLFFANGTSAKGLDLSAYYAEKFNKVGVTLFASRNTSEAYDPADIGFSAIPDYTRYTINPRVYFYFNEKSKLMAGASISTEERVGGDMQFLKGNDVHAYFERNNTSRYSTELSYTYAVNDDVEFNFKNSLSFFNREIRQPDYFFGGDQLASFSELTLQIRHAEYDWVFGANLWTDDFEESKQANVLVRDYSSVISGIFAQNLWEINPSFTLESGLRIDYSHVKANDKNGLKDWFVLPRLSGLIRFSPQLTSRIGGGLGYKTPTVFTEKAEEQVFRYVRPIVFNEVKSERSYGLNADINYHTVFGEDWSFSINQLFFYTRIQTPLIFNADSLANRVYHYENADGHIDAMGTETNIKIAFKNFKLFWGYTFVDAQNHFQSKASAIPLTAKHRINSVLMYEIEDNLRIGLEAFYFSPQRLTNGLKTTDYWIVGFSAQKKWEHFSVFINFENLTDTRQTRFGKIYTGTMSQPEFNEIYAPLDGFVFNGGFLISL